MAQDYDIFSVAQALISHFYGKHDTSTANYLIPRVLGL